MGTARIRGVLKLFDDPQDKIASTIVHVTGTNGKGSTVEMIATGLAGLGKRVGVFTSPFLIVEEDSIRMVSGTVISNIPKSEWDSIRSGILSSVPTECSLSDFELLFLTAVLYFKGQSLDVAVIEVGMGGRDDATNVFTNPKMAPICILTGVSLDHQKFLGPTVEDICENKCGIIKPGSTVVVNGEIPKTCLDIVNRMSSTIGAAKVLTIAAADACHLDPPLNGEHQKILTKIALTVISQICDRVDEKTLMNHVFGTHLPGRLEWRNDSRVGFPVLLDGAHNPESVHALREFVDSHRCGRPVCWIIAASKGREDMVPFLLDGLHDKVILVQFRSFQEDTAGWIQPADPRELLLRLSHSDCEVEISSNEYITGAVERIKDISVQTNFPLVVVAGSLYLVRHYLREYYG